MFRLATLLKAVSTTTSAMDTTEPLTHSVSHWLSVFLEWDLKCHYITSVVLWFSHMSVVFLYLRFERHNSQPCSPKLSQLLTVSCYVFKKLVFIWLFLYFSLSLTHFSVARYFLPDPERSVSVCAFLHVFGLISEYGPLQCRKLHYSPGRKTFESQLFSWLSLPFLLQKGNLIFHP